MLSLSTSSRKFLPLRSNAWKVIFQVLRILLLSNFLLKSQEYLFGNRGMRLNDLVFELTALWRCQLPLLGHSQNLMKFISRWSKNSLSFARTKIDCFWSICEERSNIFLVTWMESVTTMIFDILCERVMWLIPHFKAKNSASDEVMLTALWRTLTTGLLRTWMCAINKATLFLTLVSVITRAVDEEVEDSITKASSCWRRDLKEGSFFLLKVWKEKWLEKVSITLLPG